MDEDCPIVAWHAIDNASTNSNRLAGTRSVASIALRGGRREVAEVACVVAAV